MSATINDVIDAAIKAGAPKDQLENFLKQRYIPSPKAWEFHAACRLADRDDGPTQIGCGGARGGGKSHTVFAQAILDDAQRMPGISILYLRRVGKKAREQFESLRRNVLRNTQHKYNRSEGILYLPNGSRCMIGNFNSESEIDQYLGLEYDVIVIEEHTTLTQEKHRMLRDSNRTSKPGWRPRLYSTTNPGGIGHAWYRKTFIDPFLESRQSDTKFIPMLVTDNPYIDKEYIKKLEENTGWRLRAYRYGDWNIAAGQFFTTFNPEIHVIPHEKLHTDYTWQYWLSFDYGFTHYTAVHLHCMSQEGVVYTIDEYGAQKLIPKRHAAGIKSMLSRWDIELNRLEGIFAGGDVFSRDRDGKCPADDYEAMGFKLSRANMDRVSGAAEIMDRLGDEVVHPTWFISDRCYRLIEALPAMEHDRNRPEDVMKWDCDEDGQGGDDFYDSARYGLMYAAGSRPRWGNMPTLEDWRG